MNKAYRLPRGHWTAFPLVDGIPGPATEGMNQRTYAAIHIASGMLAHSTRYRPRENAPANWHEALAEEAVEIADAIMAALDRGGAS